MFLLQKFACSIKHVKKYMGVLENIELEDVSSHELCLQKNAFEIRLGFENLEIYTLKA